MKLGPLPITLRQLQYVCAIAEELNFRRAAERCLVSQPSLSVQVAELERVLGVTLFERDRRGSRLTTAGEELVHRSREVLLRTEDLLQAARKHVDPLAGTLRFGIIPTIGPYLLPDLDPALRREFPDLELRWTEGKTASLVEMVRGGELDAALLALEADLADLVSAPIGNDEFVLAVSADHALARGKRPVRMDALEAREVLLLDDGHCFRDQALDLCSLVGAREASFRATSLTTLVQMAVARGTPTILPAMAIEVENRRDALVIRRFRQPPPKRTIGLAWRSRSPLCESLQRLIRVARKACPFPEPRRSGAGAST